jgi:uncharacterized membrane protein YtjA (UPF0391 family)
VPLPTEFGDSATATATDAPWRVIGLRVIWRNLEGEVRIMLWTIFVILLVLWLLGFLSGIGGGTSLIHLLLVLAVIVLVINLVTGRRTV